MAITKIQSESLNLADDYSFTGTITGAGESNTPAFSANRITTFSFSVNTWTKLILNNELYDTASAYDTTNARFTVPSGQAGKYHFSAHFISYEATANNNIGSYNLAIYKNGSLELWLSQNEGASLGSYRMNIIAGDLDLTVGDYIELYGRVNTTGTAEINVSSYANRFSGFRISS